LTYTLAFVP